MADSRWPLRTIDELKSQSVRSIAIGPFGSRMKSDCYVASGVPVVRGNNISNTRGLVGEMVYISSDKAEELHSSIIYADDLFFPHRGAIGQVGIVPPNGADRYILSSSLMKLTCDRKQVEPLYLFYFFRSEQGRHELLKNASTVGTPGIGQPLSTLKSIQVPTPSLSQQKAITRILGTLDDKIELNRQMNATLEAMAQALFQSWFVDFDPVRAKLDGRKPAGLDAATAALFPEHLEDSTIGKKPIGWEVTTLEVVLADLETGGRPKGGVAGITSGIPSIGAESIVSIGHFDFGKTKFVPVEFYEGMKKGWIESRDVLLYKDGGRPGEYEPHVSMFGDGFPFKKCCINEHVYRLRGNERLSQEYLYFWLTSDLAFAEMRVKGTGVAIPGLNSTAVRSLAVLVPSRPVVDAFTHRVESLVTQLLANAKQSRTLAILRDALLPKLISDELRVKANEPHVADVTA